MFESEGLLWAGFHHGAIAYLPIYSSSAGKAGQTEAAEPRLQLWQPEEGVPAQSITGFAEDKSGGRWFSTYGEGLYVWKNERLYQFNVADDGLLGDEIYALASDVQGRIWAATDAGISICAMPLPGQKQVQNLTTADGLPDEIITALLADPQGAMWIGTHDNGICCYDLAVRGCVFVAKNWTFGPVTDLALFGGCELWAGTEKNGLVYIEAATGQARTLPTGHALRSAKMQALYKDREGLL